MKYYFAARYNRHPEMRSYRDDLQRFVPGAIVTSRWIDCHGGELDASFTPEKLNADPKECWRLAGQVDLEDLDQSDVIVSFTGDGGGGKGGRHIEHGIAIAYTKMHRLDNIGWEFRLVLVGPRENIFHCHPKTEVFDSWDAFLVTERERFRL